MSATTARGSRALAALAVVAAMTGASVVGAQTPSATPRPTTTAPSAAAPAVGNDAHRRDDVVRHRAIAAAHEAAAKCLESGQKESACHDTLRKACEGLAVGRYCGMKHSH